MKNQVLCIPLTHSACLHMMFYMVLDLFSNNTHTLWEFYKFLTFDSVSDSEYFYNKYFRKPKVKCVSNCFSLCFLRCLAFLWDVLRLSRAGTCRLFFLYSSFVVLLCIPFSGILGQYGSLGNRSAYICVVIHQSIFFHYNVLGPCCFC